MKDIRSMSRYTCYISIISMALMCLWACHENEDGEAPVPDEPTEVPGKGETVVIEASIGNVQSALQMRTTPFGTEEEQSRFNVGDKLGVEAGTQTVVVYILQNGGTWQADGDANLTWEDASMGFRAYYPADAQGISITGFNVPSNQTTLEDLAKADYMTFRGTASNDGSNIVSLVLERQMARIVIDEIHLADVQEAGSTVVAVKVHDNTYGYEHGNAKEGNVIITAYKHTDGKFYALVSPTKADATATFLTVTVQKSDGTQVEMSLTGIPDTTNGNSYDYELTASDKQTLAVSSVSVVPWSSKDVIDGKADEKH